MGTGCGRGRHVPHNTASSTTRPSARPRFSDRCTSSRNGPKRAWSSHNPRLQNRQLPRAALAQNQHNKMVLLRYGTVVEPGQPVKVVRGFVAGGELPVL